MAATAFVPPKALITSVTLNKVLLMILSNNLNLLSLSNLF
jgi:hypothetical protein